MSTARNNIAVRVINPGLARTVRRGMWPTPLILYKGVCLTHESHAPNSKRCRRKVRTVMVDSLAAKFTVLHNDTQTRFQIWTASRWAEVCTVRLIGRPVSSKCSLMVGFLITCNGKKVSTEWS